MCKIYNYALLSNSSNAYNINDYFFWFFYDVMSQLQEYINLSMIHSQKNNKII